MMIGSKRRHSHASGIEWRHTFIWFPTKCIVDNRYIWLEPTWQFRTARIDGGWSSWHTVSPDDIETLIREKCIFADVDNGGWKVAPDSRGYRFTILDLVEQVCYGIY